ncbi:MULTISPECIES: helix-turn-helix domain-containing protein [Streptomyces]|uniref:PucR family transcriptional regulator n=1 Tax=Streptomyces TaxID=1883 RepID=UPI0004CB6DBB|nr:MULTISPECIES: helix-turn-helix domain-containing protein [Streptomyces]RPK90041.1 carbohydrate diacid transcriptional activator CdaR [Streptomyces sp. ADI98-10]
MTDPQLKDISFGGVLVHRQLSAHARDLAMRVVDELAGQLPAYGALPLEELRSEIMGVSYQCIHGFVEVLRTGELPGREQLAVIREAAADRAEEGLMLDSVISAYHVGAQVVLDTLSPMAGPQDVQDVLTLNRVLMQYLQRVTAAGVGGYFQERQAAFGVEHFEQQALLDALLAGSPAQDAADRAGISLPARFLVLSLAVGAHPDERTPGVDPVIAGRRKLRRLRRELERHVPGVVLSALSVDGGLALLPLPDEQAGESAAGLAGDVPEAVANWTGGILGHMMRVSGAAIIAGVAISTPDGVHDGARLAGDVRKVAQAARRPPGPYRLADVLLEYQLTRPGPALAKLSSLLAPLAGKPELLETLRAYLSCAMDRRSTAERLSVHPNTLDYRLRRITGLTGLDATRQADLARVQAALAAYDAHEYL